VRKSRFSEEPIIAILKESEAGVRTEERAGSTGSRRRASIGGRVSS
jgi:hypothetical protein